MDSVLRTINQGIDAIKAGQPEEGAKLLRVALRDENLKGRLRSTVYMWLAYTTEDIEEKKQYYTEAYSADPTNDVAQQRLAELWMPPSVRPSTPAPASANNPLVMPAPPVSGYQQRSAAPQADRGGGQVISPGAGNAVPPMPLITPPAKPFAPPVPMQNVAPASYHIVGILDGSNGPGSGFFITQNGLIVTTRHVIDGRDNVTVELETGRQLPGQVVRSFPDLDIAFVYAAQPVSTLMQMSTFPIIPDNTQLSCICHGGRTVSGLKRETQRAMPRHLFPTDIVTLPDAGGGPVFDERHFVVGMLTRNHSTLASYVYGVTIAAINQTLEQYVGEMQNNRNRVYCKSCGSVSQAAGAGAHYCDICGTTMPYAVSLTRIMTPQIASFYQEHEPVLCSYCGARAGAHKDICVRCGRNVTTGEIPKK